MGRKIQVHLLLPPSGKVLIGKLGTKLSRELQALLKLKCNVFHPVTRENLGFQVGDLLSHSFFKKTFQILDR